MLLLAQLGKPKPIAPTRRVGSVGSMVGRACAHTRPGARVAMSPPSSVSLLFVCGADVDNWPNRKGRSKPDALVSFPNSGARLGKNSGKGKSTRGKWPNFVAERIGSDRRPASPLEESTSLAGTPHRSHPHLLAAEHDHDRDFNTPFVWTAPMGSACGVPGRCFLPVAARTKGAPS